MRELEDAALFRAAFDNAPVGVAIVALDPFRMGELLQVNTAFAAMVGLDRVALEGTSFLEVVHAYDHRAVRDYLAQMQQGRCRVHQAEKRVRRPDGQWRWVRSTTSVVDEGGEPRFVVEHLEDVSARRAAEEELLRRALYDPLTGLANRTLLIDHLEMAVRETTRERRMLAVLHLDIDRFKQVNDSLGRDAGDRVLQALGARLSAVVRLPDTAARLTSDEFVVAARVRSDVDAIHLAERLHAHLSEPIAVDEHAVVVEPSIGLTTTTDPGARPEELLHEADLAMAQAKQPGVGRWAVYDLALHQEALGRLATEESLRAALLEGHLRLEYQPIVDLTTGRIVSAEALLRLDDPVRGTLSPDAFLDVAEASDLIVPIGGWVLEEACRALATWQVASPAMQVSVNVSARQVIHLRLHDQVRKATQAAGTDPHRLMLELTEHVLLDADEATTAELLHVAADGCALAVDDFGTGYASLSYLKRYPVSVVKIDRSFVDGLGVPGEDQAIVEAVTGLARTLGLVAVGEGVETGEQASTLRDLGCARGQGFHLGRPVAADVLARTLAEQG